MLTQSGGTCVCTNTEDPTCSTDVEYNNCLLGESSRNSAIQGTDFGRYQQRSHNSDCSHCWHWLICIRIPHQSPRCPGVSSLRRYRCRMLTDGSPRMGLNAYFTYQVVGFHGTGPVSYRLALTAVFVEGFVFVFLSLIGMRQWLVKVIPSSIKVASGVGIGMFLTMIGMSASGIGLISGSPNTPTDIAGCAPKYQDAGGHCNSHKMTNPTVCLFPHSSERSLTTTSSGSELCVEGY